MPLALVVPLCSFLLFWLCVWFFCLWYPFPIGDRLSYHTPLALFAGCAVLSRQVLSAVGVCSSLLGVSALFVVCGCAGWGFSLRLFLLFSFCLFIKAKSQSRARRCLLSMQSLPSSFVPSVLLLLRGRVVSGWWLLIMLCACCKATLRREGCLSCSDSSFCHSKLNAISVFFGLMAAKAQAKANARRGERREERDEQIRRVRARLDDHDQQIEHLDILSRQHDLRLQYLESSYKIILRGWDCTGVFLREKDANFKAGKGGVCSYFPDRAS